jgi:hypothetical protein
MKTVMRGNREKLAQTQRKLTKCYVSLKLRKIKTLKNKKMKSKENKNKLLNQIKKKPTTTTNEDPFSIEKKPADQDILSKYQVPSAPFTSNEELMSNQNDQNFEMADFLYQIDASASMSQLF